MTEKGKEDGDIIAMQLERIELAGIQMTDAQKAEYLRMSDDLGEYKEGMTIPLGFKKCGRCKHVMKFYLFNKNNGSKTNTTGNCKVCQKVTASKSYGKTKQKRNYKKYYQENREMKQEQARKYYEANKDTINARHKEYLTTKKGQKVMHKAHKKRREAIAGNKGIPYTRERVIERDRRGGEFPICYLCGQPILDTSGATCQLDHVISIGNGGKDCFTNVAATHITCNLSKEKDDRNLSADQVAEIVALSEAYIDCHPEYFDDSPAEEK